MCHFACSLLQIIICSFLFFCLQAAALSAFLFADNVLFWFCQFVCAQLFIMGLLSLHSFHPSAFHALGAGGGRVSLVLFLPQLIPVCWQPPCFAVVCVNLYIEECYARASSEASCHMQTLLLKIKLCWCAFHGVGRPRRRHSHKCLMCHR